MNLELFDLIITTFSKQLAPVLRCTCNLNKLKYRNIKNRVTSLGKLFSLLLMIRIYINENKVINTTVKLDLIKVMV